MGRKAFQDYANVFCAWTEEWLGHYEDLQLLSRRHAGLLTIDLLTGDSTIDGEVVPTLRFSQQCADWLESQLNSRQISRDLISRAELAVNFVVELTGKDDDRSLVANCQYAGRCVIATPDREYYSDRTCSRIWGYMDPHARPGVDPTWEK